MKTRGECMIKRAWTRMNSSKLGKIHSEAGSEEHKASLVLKDSTTSLEVVLDKVELASKTHSVIYSKSSRNSLDKEDHKGKLEDLVEDNSKQRDKTLL